jgi:hypothetical protein
MDYFINDLRADLITKTKIHYRVFQHHFLNLSRKIYGYPNCISRRQIVVNLLCFLKSTQKIVDNRGAAKLIKG